MLDSEAQSLRAWIDDQKLGVRRLADDPRLREQLAANLDSDAFACDSPRARKLVAQLDQALAESGTAAFNVVMPSGR